MDALILFHIHFHYLNLLYLLLPNQNKHSFLKPLHAFLYLLKQQVTVEGSTGCLRSSLSKKFYSMLDIAGSEDFFGNTMEALEEEKKIVLGSGVYVYYKEYLDVEREIAEKIKSLQKCYMTNIK